MYFLYSKINFYFLAFLFTFFLFNMVFPLVGDDFCHVLESKEEIFEVIKATYYNWVPRFGQLVAITYKSFINVPFALFNTLAFWLILYLVFPLLYARKAQTNEDLLSLMLIISLLISFSVFGAVFFWRAASLNFLWGIAFCAIHAVVYRYYYVGQRTWYDTAPKFFILLFCLESFIAGASILDLSAVILLIHALCMIYQFKAGRRQELRYIAPCLCLLLGFVLILTAPGLSIRSQQEENFVSLASLFDWLTSLEIRRIFVHFLHCWGESMYKTNYLNALTTFATLFYFWKLQSSSKFLPFKKSTLICVYLGITSLSLGILFSYTLKPTGHALAGIILLTHFIFSIAGLYYLFLNKKLVNSKNYSLYIIILVIHSLMLIDALTYTVGYVPGKRAYIVCCLLSALVLVLLARIHFSVKAQRLFVIPFFIMSIFCLSLKVYGVYLNDRLIKREVVFQSVSSKDIVINNQLMRWKAKNFYDWGILTTDSTHWCNTCVAQFYNVRSMKLVQPIINVDFLTFISYLWKNTHDLLSESTQKHPPT